MESPMRNFCSLEPARKKSRNEGAFGAASSEVVLDRGMIVDASLQKVASVKLNCCHVCGNAAVDSVITNPKCTTAADSISGQSNITMKTKEPPKSHSLLNYFTKGKASEKKPAFKPSLSKQSSILENNPTICQYCDKPTCSSCTRQCELCCRDFCTFCSKVDYGGVVEKIMCFECGNGEIEKYSSDADMMDI
jgi:hypothetical protein